MIGTSPIASGVGFNPISADIIAVNKTAATAFAVGDLLMTDFKATVATNFDIGDPASVFAACIVPVNTATTGNATLNGLMLYPHVVAVSSGGNAIIGTAIAAGAEFKARMYGVVQAYVIRPATESITKGDALWPVTATRDLTGNTTIVGLNTKLLAIALETTVMANPAVHKAIYVFFNGFGITSAGGT